MEDRTAERAQQGEKKRKRDGRHQKKNGVNK